MANKIGRLLQLQINKTQVYCSIEYVCTFFNDYTRKNMPLNKMFNNI